MCTGYSSVDLPTLCWSLLPFLSTVSGSPALEFICCSFLQYGSTPIGFAHPSCNLRTRTPLHTHTFIESKRRQLFLTIREPHTPLLELFNHKKCRYMDPQSHKTFSICNIHTFIGTIGCLSFRMKSVDCSYFIISASAYSVSTPERGIPA